MNDDMQSPLPTPSQEARQWAMFCHFAAFLGLVFPFGNLLGPLIVWQIKKDFDPFVDAQGKEALNFQISVALAAVVCFILMVVVIGFPLLMLLGLAGGAGLATTAAAAPASGTPSARSPR